MALPPDPSAERFSGGRAQNFSERPVAAKSKTWLLSHAVAIPLALYLLIVLVGYDGGPYLRGDCPLYVAAAVSLWQDHDVDLSNQVHGDPAGLSDWVSVSVDGR